MATDIKDVERMYEKGVISLPLDSELQDDFDDVMGNFKAILSSELDKQVIDHLHGKIGMKYRRNISGAQYTPDVPKTAEGLFDFIDAKSTPYETLLLKPAAKILGNDMTERVQQYESQKDTFFRETTTSCQKHRQNLPHRQDYTHMAVLISKKQVPLSMMVEMKEFFSNSLQLENTLFEGFEEGNGCVVFFFSITRVAATQLFDTVEPYLSELKTKFEMTYLIAFEYCLCDLERSARRKCLFVSVLIYMYMHVFTSVHQPDFFATKH